MWRIGERPADTCYSELNAEPVIPAGLLHAQSIFFWYVFADDKMVICVPLLTSTNCFSLADFPEWPDVMSTWGNKMLAAVHTVSQMAAVGFGLPADAFTERMAYGPHLLAPTGKLQSAVFIKPQSSMLLARLSLFHPYQPRSCNHFLYEVSVPQTL